MLDKSLIGRESEPTVHEVEKGAIRRFAEALGETNPIHFDEGAARAAGHRSIVAPLTFPSALRAGSDLREGLMLAPGKHLLQAEQSYEYWKPIVAGDKLTVKTRVADVQERAGASGPMDILVLEDEGRDAQGQLVFRARATLVLRRG